MNLKLSKHKIFFSFFAGLFFVFSTNFFVFAWNENDWDGDGFNDYDESEIYYTDPLNEDTDGDGYDDGLEIANEYSPRSISKKMEDEDYDSDGLSDSLELKFKTDLGSVDTDGDGYDDFTEVMNNYDPINPMPIKMSQKVLVNTKKQELSVYANDVRIKSFIMSSGKPGYETPKGTYFINNKLAKAWSSRYSLWMPFWMSFIGNVYGIHELPEWPNGTKEGANHLGKAVSHGCVRLGVGDAEWLYNWIDIGTKVVIE